MSIDNKLRQIIQIKSDIKDAIVDKGVEMPAGLPFDQYASKVSEISGSGGDPIIKGYRQFERAGSYDIDENFIAKMTGDGSPKMSLTPSPYGTQFVVRVKVTDLHSDKPNILFGGDGQTFCIGTGASNLRLGVWLESNYGSTLQGDAGGNGETDFYLELNKWYFLRFTFKGSSISGLPYPQALVELDIKENTNDEYTNIYRTETIIYGDFHSGLGAAYFGGTYFGGGFFSKCEVDLKQSYAIQLSSPTQGFNPTNVPYC